MKFTLSVTFRKHKPLSRCDVGFQSRDVGRPHFGALSIISRRWPQRRDVGFQHARERRDVGFQSLDVGLSDSRECRELH